MLKLAIDITALLDQYSNRGIGTYTRNLVREIMLRNEIQIHLIGFKTEKDNLSKLGLSSFPQNVVFHSLGAIQPSSAKNIFVWKKLYMPLLKKIAPDIYIAPNFERGIQPNAPWKNIVVIHDIIPVMTGNFSNKSIFHNILKKQFYLRQLKKALKAEHIVTISKFSKLKLISRFNIPESKITVNYPALDIEFQKKIDIDPRRTNVILKSLQIRKEFILYYGGLELNKNVNKLIEAFQKIALERNDIDLVIVSNEIRSKHNGDYIIKGSNGKQIARLVNQLKLTNRVIFTGELGKEDLKILTSTASIFVHLSKFEGFGLSVLEAISVGTPSIISNIEVYKELFYENAVFTDPDNTQDIVKQISNLLNNVELKQNLKNNREKLLNKFSWNKHVDIFIKIINQLVDTNTPALNDSLTRAKIGYVIPHFYPFKGGAENYTLDIATYAAKSNFDVSVFTSKNSTFDNEFDIFQRIKIFRSTTLINLYYLKFYPGLFIKLWKADLDVIHVQGFGFIWQDICLILRKFIGKKKTIYINTPHGPFMARSDYNNFYKFLKRIYTSIQKLYLNWLYERIIAVNPEQYKWMEKEYGIKKDKIKFLPIGISKSQFETAVAPSKVTKEFEILKNKLILSYVGRFHKYKGVIDILETIKRIISETDFRDFKLFLIGKDAGELKNINTFIIENRLDAYVEVIENASDNVRNYILDHSEIFIFPSEWEAYGIAMLEAMAHGNAIISTRTEGGLYLVENNVNGILYNNGDIDALYKAIIRLIGNIDLRQQIIQANFNKADNLRWEQIWSEYEALYKEII
jgi:glycosyltransferase involved in cell wall biosynthesis